MKTVNTVFANSVIILLLAISSPVIAQTVVNKGIFKTYEPGYFQTTIQKGIDEFDHQVPAATGHIFKVNPAEFKLPSSRDGFTTYWHNETISQGNTNTCWSFSTTSFLESEIFRLSGQKVKLSMMHTVYYEYIERAINWVKTRGKMEFGEGSEANAVTKIWKKYGVVPYDSYTGFLPGQTVYNHSVMFDELKKYVEFVKANNLWDEDAVIANFKSILGHYMGEPPTAVTIEGRQLTPKQYMSEVLKINPDNYVSLLSYMQQPYWKQVEYEVPDNWWHSKEYYNVPLEDYMSIIKKSITSGYTLAIGGDVSEAGYMSREANAAVVPSFDIPSEKIDENARQFRFSNETTTDDHGLHMVGYKMIDNVMWFLIKDSAAGCRQGSKDNKNFGYMFYHPDYVKLKMMDFMVHKDMVKDILPRFEK